MTFFGFDEKAVDAERQKLYDSFRKAEEFDKLPPEERAKHFLLCGGGFCRVGYPRTLRGGTAGNASADVQGDADQQSENVSDAGEVHENTLDRGGHRLLADGLLCPSNMVRVALCNVSKNVRVN